MDAYTIADIAIGLMTLILLVIGLYRGLSGELASCAGFVGAFSVCFLFCDHAAALAQMTGCSAALFPIVTGAITLGFGIVAYGLIRVFVNKFVSMCVPQPTNALLGMALGAVKAAGIVVALLWFHIVGIDENAFLEVKSPVICRIAEIVEQYASGEAL